MRNNLKNVILLLAAVLMVTSAAAEAQSIFSSFGLGELRYNVNARSAGMGGTGIAIIDPLSQNHINPATWVYIQKTSISAGMRFEGINYNNKYRNINSRDAAVNSYSLTIKTSPNFAIGGGLHPFFDNDYSVVIPSDTYVQFLTANGGTTIGYLGAAYRVSDNLTLGVNYNVVFGKQNEQWRIVFDQTDYLETQTEFTRSIWGSGITVGATGNFGKRLNLGGVFTTEMNLKTTNRVVYNINKSTKVEGDDISVPMSYGLGASFIITPQVLINSDIYRWELSDLSYNWSNNQEFRNSTRFSVGLELIPQSTLSSSFFKKVIYRCGFYNWDLYSRDIDNSPLSEKFITAGFSIPFSENQARIDIALEGGLRSSSTKSLGSEKIWRLKVDFIGGELWFIR